MKSNIQMVGIIFFFNIMINQVSLSLGLTSTVIESPETLTGVEYDNIFEQLLWIPIWAFNQLGSLFQILTYQSVLPSIVATIIYIPNIILLVLIVLIIRGGAS